MAHSHPIVDADNHFVIDPITRAVENAQSKKTILMQHDHNSERFTFEIDRLVEGHDMSLCNKIEIHYVNEDQSKNNRNPGVYEVDDMADNDDKLTFSWLVSENATMYAGSLRFLIVFSCVENGEVTYRWNTNINTSISIAKGMNNGEEIEEAYPDVLTQWRAALFAAIYGMETTYVGPTEPETYPYIWFDTSRYLDGDGDIGVITVKDAEGNKRTLYPFAKLAGTDAADIRTELSNINTELNGKINTDKIVNDIAEIEEDGYVLDARIAAVLKAMIDGKVSKSGDTIQNQLVATRTVDEIIYKGTFGVGSTGNVYLNHYTDGTQDFYMILNANGLTLSKPLSVAYGGTGATTIAGARRALAIPAMTTYSVTIPVSAWMTTADGIIAPVTTDGLFGSYLITDVTQIIDKPLNESFDEYTDCKVRIGEIAEGSNKVTFIATKAPTSDLNVTLMAFFYPTGITDVTPKETEE